MPSETSVKTYHNYKSVGVTIIIILIVINILILSQTSSENQSLTQLFIRQLPLLTLQRKERH